jgi:hypothetical protein
MQLKQRSNKKAAITAAMGWEIIVLIIMIALGLLAALLILNKIFLMGGKF